MSNPTRTYRAVIVKRMTDEYESIVTEDSAVYLSTAFTAWRLNLDRASSLDFLLVWRHGKIIDVATVYGAEPIAARHGGGDRVRLIAGAVAPKAEPLIGAEVEMSNRNPVAYADIIEDLITGEIPLAVSA